MFAELTIPPVARPILYVAVAGVGLLIVIRLVRMVAGAARRRRPVRIHPNLQRYAGLTPEQMAERDQLAARILTTSSQPDIPGYVTVQQVEAVYVDGFRDTNEAMLALKAEAGRKGANAILNVKHERAAMNRCSASGDAVIVRRSAEGPGPAGDRDA